MTPKELLGWSVDDLEKLSQEELEKIFSPFYKVTRPQESTRQCFDKPVVTGPIKDKRLPKKVSASQHEKDVMLKAKRLMEQYGFKL